MTDIVLTAAAPLPIFSSKQIACFYFSTFLDEEGERTGYQQCKGCGKCRKHMAGTGYTNLVSHVRQVHPKYEEEMRDASTASTGSLMAWTSKKASNRYGWLCWIIKCDLPFSFCESPETRRFTNLSPISVEPLLDIMEGVTKAGERLIGTEIPDTFGLMLDGWRHGTEHYLAVFASFEIAVKVLMGDAADLTAVEREVLRPFQREDEVGGQDDAHDGALQDSFGDRVLNRRKVVAPGMVHDLIAAIPPTSKEVERIFSST